MYNSDKLITPTKEFILKRTTEYDIYSYYLGFEFKIGKPFNSPFREDRNPSFSIFKTLDGTLLYKDFSTGEAGDCIKFVKILFLYHYYKDALRQIYIDIIDKKLKRSEEGENIQRSKPKRRKKIGIRRRRYNKEDYLYWESYGISKETLKHFEVYAVDHVWVENKLILNYKKDNPIYAYKVFNSFKIYKPKEKKSYKFLTNCSMFDIQGLPQLEESGELLIITKAMKDVMCLYELGYKSIAPNGENHSIPEYVMHQLKNKFSNILVLYDNDKAGHEGAEKLQETYGLRPIFIPDEYDCKDISDFIQNYGVDKAKILLSEITKISCANEKR